jgi:hypothetical protein
LQPVLSIKLLDFGTSTITLIQICKNKVKRNIYCKELEKIIYVSKEFDHFKIKEEEELEMGESLGEIDQTMQLKTIRPSPDGKHIAAGDLTGHIRVFD